MKNLLILLIVLGLGQISSAQTTKEKMEKVSYSLGVLVAQNLQGQGFESIDGDKFKEAFMAVLNGQPTSVDVNEANTMIQMYMSEKAKEKNKDQIEAGKQFLIENAKKPNIVTLPSGLQYEVLKEGTGPKPTLTSTVTTHYVGTLINGEVFDSSVERGQPASFPVNGVIKGWTEALQLMNTGSKWRLFVPSDLAYGDRGAGGKIGPFATLIFEVELISIDK